MTIKDIIERQKHIRNFSIIAHIDHGKSTLADRILELTHSVEQREMKEQILDSMDLERERGITIKLNAVEVLYTAKNGENYIFHLIDTPGHVDFTYEVSRSLAACEGALLVIDATQGIQAQTLANVYLAMDNDLLIIPVINKIDLPSADVDNVKTSMENILALDSRDALLCSAKTGLGVGDILEAIVERVPAPTGDPEAPLQALIFDSFYDSYRGIIPFICVKQGMIKPGDKIKFMATNAVFEVIEVGIHNPKEQKRDFLSAGDVGWIAAAIKDIKDVRVGDTITGADNSAQESLPGYRQLNPMVYCGLFPTDNNKFNALKDALEKLKLNDAALVFEPETSTALGYGFRCGFLGLLHMDVVQERLEREFNLDLIATAPTVDYKVILTDGTLVEVQNPSMLPDPTKIKEIQEPMVLMTLMCPNDSVGPVMQLCQDRRGTFKNMTYVDTTRTELQYDIPLSEIIFDFFDKLKSVTHGYASYDYELTNFKASKLVKMDILLNGDGVDALSSIVYEEDAHRKGINICRRLKELLPRQLFEVPIQAAIGSKIVARCTLSALAKDVLAKCYGGDISRKKKLLEKQKEGKKRMKAFGKVEIPQDAFLAVLDIDPNDKH